MTSKNVKIIFDTNVWISFLTGKKLTKIKQYIVDKTITIVITEQLLKEIKIVTKPRKNEEIFPERKCERTN